MFAQWFINVPDDISAVSDNLFAVFIILSINKPLLLDKVFGFRLFLIRPT